MAKRAPKENFEAALKRLEAIVDSLEKGDTPLEKAIDLYEEGIQISKACAETLSRAELRIKKLSKGASKQFELTSMDDEDDT